MTKGTQHSKWNDMAFNWNNNKNEWLKKERGISFQEVVIGINEGKLVHRIEHPDQTRFSGQFIFLVRIQGYIWAIPYVYDKNKNEYFLKTAYPSRRYNREFGGKTQ